jgi:hypothetical protein
MLSKNIRPNKVNFPAVQGIGGPSFLGKVLLKNLYQEWRGENFVEITNKALDNPFNLRTGLPQTDKQLKDDRVFLFTKYLSYNPLTKQIEKRELIPLRNVEKIYIGQSPEEHQFKDYKLFVDGRVIVEDVLFKQPNQHIGSLVNKIQALEEKIQILEYQVQKLTLNTEKQAIYNQ